MKTILQHINESQINESRHVGEFKYVGLLDFKNDTFKYGYSKGDSLSGHFNRPNEKLTIGWNSSSGSWELFPLISSSTNDFSYTWITDSDEEITEFITKVSNITVKEMLASKKEYQYYF